MKKITWGLAGFVAAVIMAATLTSTPPSTNLVVAPAAALLGSQGGGVQAITPVRILDSRTTNGGHNATFTAGETFNLQVLVRGVVPLTGVAAIIGNVTAISTTNGGYLTLFPAGYPKPASSNVNFPASSVVANQFMVPLGANGAISIYSFPAAVNVVIDVQGWVSSAELAASGPSVAFDTTALTSSDGIKAAQVLTNANKYAMTTWWDGPAQTLLAANLGVGGANNGDAVRRLSMQALALSTALATGSYDAGATGVSAAVATQRTAQMIDTVASWHLINHLSGWGEGWQTPMWAGIVGRAAWYIWPQLSSTTQASVARMVEQEADFATRKQIHYLRDAAGNILTSGDSGAEEVSWNTNAMQIALVMLPNHPHAWIWRTELVRFSLAAWARPADVGSSTVVNGRPLSSWLTGSNVETNGVVINHSRVASDYSTTTYQNLDTALLFPFAGLSTPEAIRSLLGPVYAAFRGVTFPTPTYVAPGGETYVAGTADIYYPQPIDWGTGQKLPYALADAQALVFGYDSGSAATYLALHLDAQLTMQARFSDGKTYLSDVEYNYEGREEHAAQLASQLYLTLYLRDHSMVSFSNDSI